MVVEEGWGEPAYHQEFLNMLEQSEHERPRWKGIYNSAMEVIF